MTEPVYLDFEGGIGTITLNRPDTHNALDGDTIPALVDALIQCELKDDIRVIILQANGRSFCAGGNIKDMEKQEGMFEGDSFALRRRYQWGIQEIPRTIERMDKPIIALVQGAAIGAGLDLSCMCDIRLATDQAKFGETFTGLNLVPGDGGGYFLSRVIGLPRAMEMTLTGEIINAQKALEWGLINYLVAKSDLVKEGLALAQKIAARGPYASQLSKKALKLSYRQDLATVLEMMSTYQGITQRTNDHFEGLKAMREKRAPEFKGE